MKILKKGSAKTSRRTSGALEKVKIKSWVGKKLTCKECGCQFELEKNDRVFDNSQQDCPFQDERGDHCHACQKVRCPQCKSWAYFWS